jgi:hypothetical protein
VALSALKIVSKKWNESCKGPGLHETLLSNLQFLSSGPKKILEGSYESILSSISNLPSELKQISCLILVFGQVFLRFDR